MTFSLQDPEVSEGSVWPLVLMFKPAGTCEGRAGPVWAHPSCVQQAGPWSTTVQVARRHF